MSRKKTSIREYTNKFIEGMKDGSINAQVLAEGLLCAMSESNVEDFAHREGYFQYEDEDEDEDEDEEKTVVLETEDRKDKPRWRHIEGLSALHRSTTDREAW